MNIDLQTLRNDFVNDPGSDSAKVWWNGLVFYSQGMVMDVHRLGQILAGDVVRHQDLLISLLGGGEIVPADSARLHSLIASHQMHLAWLPVRNEHLHREATALENTRLGLELALKAILTRCRTQYDRKHDLIYLWELLYRDNRPLVHEIQEESRTFHHSYAKFVSRLGSLQTDLREVHERLFTYGLEHMAETRRISKAIDSLAQSSSYSCLPNGYAPDSDHWLDDCLNSFRDLKDREVPLWTYLRYGDAVGDDMPTHIIRSVHLAARFMYEHLVPMPRQSGAHGPMELWPELVEKIWKGRFVEGSK